MSEETIESKLKVLAGQVAGCVRCGLHATRTQTVFARGNSAAKLVIVGEAPGQQEDEQGIPFVGVSGALLDKTLTELGLDVAKDIYVANSLKCRPPNNRKPTEDELNTCAPFFEGQIKLVSPKVIVALGNTAVSALLPIEAGITKIHGKFFKRGSVFVMPAYHPSYVLRNGGSGVVFEEFRADLKSAIEKVKELA
jgi:uracil-DNA glycosylase family 4